MKYLLDTNVYSAFNRGDTRLRNIFVSTNELLLPLIVVGELRAGFAAGNKPEQNEKLLQQFLDSPAVSTVTISDQTTRQFAKIYKELKQAGRLIGTNDLWIAALALEHNITLVTLDNDFSALPALKLAPL